MYVETDNGVFQSSIVQTVEWRRNSFRVDGLESDPWFVIVSGGAPFVILPSGAVIVATVGGEPVWGFGRMLIEEVRDNGAVRYSPVTEETLIKMLAATDVVAEIESPALGFPAFYGFANRLDQDSVFWVSPDDPSNNELGIRSAKLTVKKTKSPLDQSDIRQALPWMRGGIGYFAKVKVDDGREIELHSTYFTKGLGS